ncbi:hypothetical protein FRX31_012408 [Thalictrum thalictroides]|uniref:Uncharacterized protein n=1 Tax=Thalictrum thalictroides TaxID=46969 RepID=A0A7J6WNH3_THATH|nr:hypothetical protein FRX31_012408 [Thalictrum thalictroides]
MANTRSQSIRPRDASPHAVDEVQSNVVIDAVFPTSNVVVDVVAPNGRHAYPNVPTGQTRHLVSNAADAIIKAKVLKAQAAAMKAQAAGLAAAEATALPRNSAMRNTAYATSQALAASTESGAAVATQSVNVVDI